MWSEKALSKRLQFRLDPLGLVFMGIKEKIRQYQSWCDGSKLERTLYSLLLGRNFNYITHTKFITLKKKRINSEFITKHYKIKINYKTI